MSEVGLGVVVAIGAVRALDLKVSLRPFPCGWVKYVKGKVKDYRTINTWTEERYFGFRTEVEGKTFISHFDNYWSICCSLYINECQDANVLSSRLHIGN